MNKSTVKHERESILVSLHHKATTKLLYAIKSHVTDKEAYIPVEDVHYSFDAVKHTGQEGSR